MSSREEEFLETLRETFRIEAAEHLQTIATGLLELEKLPEAGQRPPVIESIFRAAHSLKGASRAVNLANVEAICQSLEELFSTWKKTPAALSSPKLESAHTAVDEIAKAIAQSVSKPALSATTASILSDASPAQTVRVTVDKLDARLLEAEGMLAAKLAVAQLSTDLRSLASQFTHWRNAWMRAQPQLRASSFRAENAATGEFFEWNDDSLRSLSTRFASLCRTAELDRLTVGKLVDDLLAESKKLLMLPVSTLSTPLPKVVHDLCRDQGKQAELVVQGDEIEIDKRILEDMKDPLMHLLRNAVDHGVEIPTQRRKNGKAARATLTFEVSTVGGNQVQMRLSDDGSGIDLEAVRVSAVERGLVTEDSSRSLPVAAMMAFVFEADISTSPIVTNLSGRGLGLAIVREKVEKLGGRIAVESRPGEGTTFIISLPTTLATFRGVLIRASDQQFIVPTIEIERVIRFRQADVQTVEGRETLSHNGKTLALVHLAGVLNLQAKTSDDAAAKSMWSAVILGSGDQRVAFAVDAVLGEQEVLIKRLNKPLVRVRYIAGVTVLGSGQVVPVLKVADLLRFSKNFGAPLSVAALAAAPARSISILVAEDSITSRLLLKGILESAGYRVRTAVDGIDAFTALRKEQFDLLVSDVEMPRLNGFDLAARIRADRKLAELPVILVTALASREDQERGIAVGADAYLVKSDFDQSNLLATIRRLL